MRPVALLSAPYYSDTVTWMKLNYPVKKIEGRTVTLLSGEVYHIVTRIEDMEGMEFSGYVIAPNYRSLVDEIKVRIKHE